jgi:putative ABC transport system substrate-binding protein
MKRREFLALVSGLTVAWPLTPGAQQAKVARVGVLTPANSSDTLVFQAFREGLREFGYVDGKTIILDYRLAKGEVGILATLAEELVRIPVDIIVTDGTSSAYAARDATKTIPIVMGAIGDPVGSGLVASIARPSGNITGMSLRHTELSGKRIQLLKQAFPDAVRVSVLMNPTDPESGLRLHSTQEAAAGLGVQLTMLELRGPKELRALDPTVLKGMDGMVVLATATFWNERAAIIALAAAARIPAVYPEREYADDGGLIAYGANVPDNFKRAAGYVDRILRGSKPADLPIQHPSKFDFIVNLRTARALGLVPSPEFLVGINEVIE